jgi:hypothetical protein
MDERPSTVETGSQAMSTTYVDVSGQIGGVAQCFAKNGVKAVGRYYNYGAGHKVLSRQEAQAIVASGIAIWVVFEYYNNAPKWFTGKLGKQDATRALQCAQEIVGQPEGSAIYFAADYDEKGANYDSGIVPYFQAVQGVFRRSDGTMPYRIGVYSDGLVCRRLLEDGLVTDTWLSCSSSYAETKQFYASKKWSIAQKCGVPDLCNTSIDSDQVSRTDFGQFKTLVPLAPSHAAADAAKFHGEFIAKANRAEKQKRRRGSRV